MTYSKTEHLYRQTEGTSPYRAEGMGDYSKTACFFACGKNGCVNIDKMNLVQMIDETYQANEEQAIYYNNIGFAVGNISGVRKKYCNNFTKALQLITIGDIWNIL